MYLYEHRELAGIGIGNRIDAHDAPCLLGRTRGDGESHLLPFSHKRHLLRRHGGGDFQHIGLGNFQNLPARIHQFTRIDQFVIHHATDGRAHIGIGLVFVQLGQFCLLRFVAAQSHFVFVLRLLQSQFGHKTFRKQHLLLFELGGGQIQIGLAVLHLRLLALQAFAHRLVVHHRNHLPCLHRVALIHQQLRDRAARFRAHGRFFYRLERACKRHHLGKILRLHGEYIGRRQLLGHRGLW